MTHIDCENKARLKFDSLFRHDEGPNDTELEIQAFEAAQRDAARSMRREIRVNRRQESQEAAKRRKGWLYRELREARG